MTQKNDRAFLTRIITECRTSGFDPILFGGWAEEIRGKEPWAHRDIDFLLTAENFDQLDAFVASSFDLVEILSKRFVHKRAVIIDGIMVEFILIRKEEGLIVTDFFGSHKIMWPNESLHSEETLLNLKIKVATSHVLEFYRSKYKSIQNAYINWSKCQDQNS